MVFTGKWQWLEPAPKYIHKLDWYLQIDNRKDSQEEILESDIDLSGWELKKTLRLFRKSNPPLLEWLRSPIIYLEKYSAIDNLRNLTEIYFKPKSCLHHYYHMAEGNYREYLQKDLVKVKKYFYVLRPILACDWIRETNTLAPMEFKTLVETQVHNMRIKSEIENLLKRKVSGEELKEEPKIQILNDYLEEKIYFYSEYLNTLGHEKQLNSDQLNELFKRTITEVWN